MEEIRGEFESDEEEDFTIEEFKSPDGKRNPDIEGKDLLRDIKIVSRLEDFVSSEDFQFPLIQFIKNHQEEFNIDFDLEDGYPIQFYNYFQEYVKIIDQLLEKFVEGVDYTHEEIFECCKRLKEADPEYLKFINFILIGTEFNDFVQTMLNHKDVNFSPIKEQESPTPEVIYPMDMKIGNLEESKE